MKKIMIGFILGCILTFSISVNAVEISGQLTKIYDSITGGKIDVFDKNSNLNVRIGGEGEKGDNTGGTLILYNHSIDKPRVSAGILAKEDSGVILASDKNNICRVQIQAENSKYGDNAFIGIRDKNQTLKTYFTEEYGIINNQPVVTSNDLQNYYTKEEVKKLIEEALKK